MTKQRGTYIKKIHTLLFTNVFASTCKDKLKSQKHAHGGPHGVSKWGKKKANGLAVDRYGEGAPLSPLSASHIFLFLI